MDTLILNAFWSEILGTATLILMGAGVVANVILPKTKGFNGGWLLINFGWGLAVFTGVYVAYKSGAHLNPAVTIGLFTADRPFYSVTGPEGLVTATIEPTVSTMFIYFGAQMIGAILGAVLAFVAYKKHFDEEAPAATKLAVFSTGPEIRSYGWNFITEVIATFVLVFFVVASGNTPSGLGPLAVALVVVGIGASIGGPTGYAINPARDLGPRIAHALLPIKGKGSSDWGYSWVPVAGPLVGGVLAGLLGAAWG
ncbi:aquaporin family protein [Oerskovia turbata]|uniref:Aquaporin family protein n=1 Tax=Oerskovia turbata TaxID=1713 RepID=A0A4Q1KSE7_9CELL|nr:MIP/aquaporin family protein [Oerskovia turbata]RXR23622.1 aquaporin family protein [Oerskovia turbata]RXR32892.1 aquaporin family protein [Oerskovia turbata]TGJ95190.1 aquaporin family protein [Actinotalea fermentans ATCC 43279 = JCM 9966 = DSM 3133]